MATESVSTRLNDLIGHMYKLYIQNQKLLQPRKNFIIVSKIVQTFCVIYASTKKNSIDVWCLHLLCGVKYLAMYDG